MGTALGGMTAIREFCRGIGMQSSESTVISFIVCLKFPAKKLGGQWSSDTDLILEWHKKYLRGEIMVDDIKTPAPERLSVRQSKPVSTLKTHKKPSKTPQKPSNIP